MLPSRGPRVCALWRVSPRVALLPLFVALASSVRFDRRLAAKEPLRPQPELAAACSDGANDWRFLCPKPPGPLPPLVLAKTHKTGSSTMATIVDRLGDRRNMRFMIPADFVYLGWPGPFPGDVGSVGAPARQYDVISSHAVYNGSLMRAYVGPSPFFLTLLREPGAQALSAFNFFEAATNVSWREHLAWLEAAQPSAPDRRAARYLNPQAHDLGWYEAVGQTKAHDRDALRVQAWLRSLSRDFVDSGMVILTEYYDEGLVLLKRRLGLDLHELAYLRQKAGPYTVATPTDERLQAARGLNPVDVELYAHFNRSFQQAWAEAKGTERDADLVELRRLNGALEAACEEEMPEPARCPAPFRWDPIEYMFRLSEKARLGCEEPKAK